MATGVFTDLELIVIEWLERHKIPFESQSSLAGGYFSLGGMVVDFLLPDRRIAIRVMGEYWHKGVEPEGKAIIQREQLEAMGWTVVDIWGSTLDTAERIEQTMSRAIKGEEMLQ